MISESNRNLVVVVSRRFYVLTNFNDKVSIAVKVAYRGASMFRIKTSHDSRHAAFVPCNVDLVLPLKHISIHVGNLVVLEKEVANVEEDSSRCCRVVHVSIKPSLPWARVDIYSFALVAVPTQLPVLC